MSIVDYKSVDQAYGQRAQEIEQINELRRKRDDVSKEMKDVQRKVHAMKMGVILPSTETYLTSASVLVKGKREKMIQQNDALVNQQISSL